jgi:hypothetical protein
MDMNNQVQIRKKRPKLKYNERIIMQAERKAQTANTGYR